MPDAGRRPVTFLAIGSRGDVEPMAVLAGAAAAAGHPATVVAIDEYAGLVRCHGARFRGIGPAMDEVARLGSGWLGRLAHRTALVQPVLLGRWLAGLAAPLASALDEVPAGSAVVTGVASRDAALALVEDRGCRMATVLHTAILPTLEPASQLEGDRLCGPRAARQRFVDWYWHTVQGLSRNTGRAFRSRAGLPRHSAAALAASADRHPIWLAADPVLIPPAPDWPATCVQTGAIRPGAPSGWTPPEPLRTFLDAGEPPVSVGLGSLNDAGGAAWLELVGAAARLAGRRVVAPAVPGGPSGVVDPWLFAAGDLPHDALFPLSAGVVHHGGAGTTAAGLRAGVPSGCVPALFDQHYHGRRLAALGVGPDPVPLHRLTAARLAALIAAVAGPDHRARAF
ncbi:MAG: hypothetical protein QM582_01565, partial [Micropruina sp.]|uniref:glycosyltransferase n=1 Tax=Micropruina sp. TaxID=2737536 RepID=UPI0039E2611A